MRSVARGGVGKERVVGPADASLLHRLHLYDVAPAQQLQHRLDELPLGLRLVPTGAQRLRHRACTAAKRSATASNHSGYAGKRVAR